MQNPCLIGLIAQKTILHRSQRSTKKRQRIASSRCNLSQDGLNFRLLQLARCAVLQCAIGRS